MADIYAIMLLSIWHGLFRIQFIFIWYAYNLDGNWTNQTVFDANAILLKRHKDADDDDIMWGMCKIEWKHLREMICVWYHGY